MIKAAAKKNQLDVCKISAKSLVLLVKLFTVDIDKKLSSNKKTKIFFRSKKQKSRIYASKAQLNSVVMQMKNSLGKNINLI